MADVVADVDFEVVTVDECDEEAVLDAVDVCVDVAVVKSHTNVPSSTLLATK